MYKCFISGGCSFTAGHELKDFKEQHHSEYSWNSLVHKLICPDAKHVRTAMGGLCNSSIARRVMLEVEKNLKQYSSKEIFVTVMWTGVGRKEFFYYENNNEDDFVKTYVNDTFVGNDTKWIRKYNDERKTWLSKIGIFNLVRESYRRDTRTSTVYNTLKEIDYLQNYLKANNISFKFTSAYNDILIESKNDYVNSLYDRLNIETNFVNYIHKDEILFFNELVDLKGYDRGKDANHPLEYAHQMWARIYANNL